LSHHKSSDVHARKRSTSPDSRPLHRFESIMNCESQDTRYDDVDNSQDVNESFIAAPNALGHRTSHCPENSCHLIVSRRSRPNISQEIFGRALLGEAENSYRSKLEGENELNLPRCLVDDPENSITLPDPLNRKVSSFTDLVNLILQLYCLRTCTDFHHAGALLGPFRSSTRIPRCSSCLLDRVGGRSPAASSSRRICSIHRVAKCLAHPSPPRCLQRVFFGRKVLASHNRMSAAHEGGDAGSTPTRVLFCVYAS
jgi:hypothetical protein